MQLGGSASPLDPGRRGGEELPEGTGPGWTRGRGREQGHRPTWARASPATKTGRLAGTVVGDDGARRWPGVDRGGRAWPAPRQDRLPHTGAGGGSFHPAPWRGESVSGVGELDRPGRSRIEGAE